LVRSSDSESGLNAVFRTQLKTLDAPERALLEVVAVAGQPILEKVAVDAASIDATQWKCALTLKANHLIRANPEEEGESFEVWHERVRDAVLTSLEPARRAELHARIADSLERLTPDAMDAAAIHLQSAGMKERATDALLRAAERARNTFAFDRSARLYQRVLEQAETDDARRRDLVLQVADAWAAAGSSVRAIRAYRQALREPGSQPMSAASAIDINRKILREFVSLKDRKFTHVIPRLRSLLIPVESWVAKVRSARR
jgi:predicted ATPase